MCMKNPARFSSMGYEFLEFFNGNMMPKIGLGTWNMTDKEAEKSVEVALEAGYLHIDTAALYRNEEGVGKALHRWLLKEANKRDDLFVTTKVVLNKQQSIDSSSLEKSLNLLQLDYVDLYLIENDSQISELDTGIVEIWKAMEKEVKNKRAKAIGLSNFKIPDIEKILNCCEIRPANIQVELHARCRQLELKKFCDLNAISMVSYGTLESRRRIDHGVEPDDEAINLLDNETILRIAKKHGRTPAQILLRHLTLLNIGVILRSVDPETIRLNFKIFDFYLDSTDMEEIDKLDSGKS